MATPPRLVATGLAKAFPGLTILDRADLTVPAGEILAIRGQSGTGKSTLLHCLGLLERLDAGTIDLDGQRISGLLPGPASVVRANQIGFVFQAFHLLSDFTVEENILMAARCAGALDRLRPRAQELLHRLGLDRLAKSSIRTLSGGERQRVALCRALVVTPRLVLADEPTGNLDPITAQAVIEELIAMAKQAGASVVLVTHDPAIARRADRELSLQSGQLHTCGPDPKS